MPNMSYCRFENTYNDLIDCLDNINDEAGNERNERYRIRLIKLIADNMDLISDLKDIEPEYQQAKHNTYIHGIKLIIMKTAITTTQILKHAKKVDAAAFDKWLTKNDVNFEWLDVTLTDMNDGYYNILLEDDTNICFVNGKFIND